MTPPRYFVGLSISGGFESVDSVIVRTQGTGLGLKPEVIAAIRHPFSSEWREFGRQAVRGERSWPSDAEREVGERLARAATQAGTSAGVELRRCLAAGWAGSTSELLPSAAERFAEATGLTTVAGFAGRDRAAGGSGRLITALADYLLFSHPTESRMLIHLGGVSSILVIPAHAKFSEIRGGEVGPGNRLLDAIIRLGTRGREPFDTGGTRAAQGRCLTPLLERWQSGFQLGRTPGRPLSRTPEGGDFVRQAFQTTQELGGSLADLLCTTTHFIADCIGRAAHHWSQETDRYLITGGGIRNGMLWQRLDAALAPRRPERTDSVGLSPLARTSAGAAILTALTLDGINGSSPMMTGANGSRILGRITPGDSRNWATVIQWMARMASEYGSGAIQRAA